MKSTNTWCNIFILVIVQTHFAYFILTMPFAWSYLKARKRRRKKCHTHAAAASNKIFDALHSLPCLLYINVYDRDDHEQPNHDGLTVSWSDSREKIQTLKRRSASLISICSRREAGCGYVKLKKDFIFVLICG